MQRCLEHIKSEDHLKCLKVSNFLLSAATYYLVLSTTTVYYYCLLLLSTTTTVYYYYCLLLLSTTASAISATPMQYCACWTMWYAGLVFWRLCSFHSLQLALGFHCRWSLAWLVCRLLMYRWALGFQLTATALPIASRSFPWQHLEGSS